MHATRDQHKPQRRPSVGRDTGRIAGSRRRLAAWVAALTLLILLAIGTAAGAATPTTRAQALFDSAVARIDAYIDDFRRSFDRAAGRDALAQAERELEDSARLFRAAGADAQAARALLRIGDVRRYRDEWRAATAKYREAQALAQQAGATDVESKALMGQARASLYGPKTTGAALDLTRRAVTLAQQVSDRSYLFDAYDLLAQIQITQGDLVGAADALNRAFALEAAVADDKLLFYGYLDRADIYQKLAEQCDYERDFAPCFEAVALARRDYTAALGKAEALGWSGLAEQTRGFINRLGMREQLIRSQQSLHQLITDSATFQPRSAREVLVHERFAGGSNPHLEGLLQWIESEGGLPAAEDARGAYIRGLLSDMQGDSDAALDWYVRATDLLETDRQALYDERARGSFLADKVDFYYTLMLNLLERRRHAEAFAAMERSRSRVMSDLLASKQLALSDPQQSALYSRLQGLRSEIAQHQACLFGLRAQRLDEPACGELDQAEVQSGAPDRGAAVIADGATATVRDPAPVQTRLDGLQQDYERLAARIQTETPRLAELVVSEPPSLSQLQAALAAADSEMLAYVALESQLVLWHISATRVQVYSVFLPRSELQRKVGLVRDSLTRPAGAFDLKTGYELFLYLLNPILDEIRTDHLVLVAHDDLHYLPFQALPMEPTGHSFLGEKFQISYAPSASLYLSLPAAEPLRQVELLAVADPALRNAPSEVRAIGALFPGTVIADALPTEARVQAALAGRGLVHFAVHGRYAAHEPLLSHLYLRAGDGGDGRLTAAEMYGLPLDAARLVVLSACETGTVKATHANEVLGMMRGLLFAGADALLLSAWKIDDAATAEWMRAFYTAAASATPAAAARSAIRELRQNPAYRHPYYWSPFLLIGR